MAYKKHCDQCDKLVDRGIGTHVIQTINDAVNGVTLKTVEFCSVRCLKAYVVMLVDESEVSIVR